MPVTKAAIAGIGLILIAGIGLVLVSGPRSEALVEQEKEPSAPKRWASVRQRAERILQESLAEVKKQDEGKYPIWKLRDWPIDLAEPELLRALQESSLEDRLKAAERLIKETGAKHKATIAKALRELNPKDDISRARQAVLRLRLGDAKALQDVRDWALLDFKRERTVPAWWCPMHPFIKKPEEATCPLCKMTLLETPWRYDYPQRQAQLIGLTALADRKDKAVPALVRNILTDTSEPHWRLHAAHQWARVSPKEGLPHFRVFLQYPRVHTDALRLVDDPLAIQLKDELKAILDDSSQSRYVHIQTMDRLLAAGERDYLEKIRSLVESADTDEKYMEYGHAAVAVLGKYGTAEDLDRLTPFLDGAWAEDVAPAILRLVGQGQ